MIATAAVATVAACSSTRVRQGGPATPAELDAACCSRAAFRDAMQVAERHRAPEITARRFTHQEFWRVVSPSLTSPALTVDSIGASMLGRPIRSVTFGSGPTRVLLWSQMHGDEATATMALADVFRFLAAREPSALRDRLRRELTVVFVPMLNPDGAELFQRENAVGIDVNRDARRLVTPEARALRGLHERVRPAFGFNLHDQGARTRAGRGGVQSGIALLPPAFDEARSYNDIRSRARLVTATLATAFGYEIPGRIAKYDDTFNPRAFGDLMGQWGTSTILIESGALPDDPQKQRLRTLNVAGLLVALDAIATRGYERADPAAYESLPFNATGASDLLVRGAQLVLPGRAPVLVDIAINYDDAVARTGGRVRDVGDLSDVIAIDTVNAEGLFLHPGAEALAVTPAGPMLRIGAAAEFTLRRGLDAMSAVARRIGG